MTAEYWLLAALGALVAAAIGFFAGRRSAPTQQRLDAMERERDEARREAERVQAEVARHFEQSARMFGRLADDYRGFFEHFAETAQKLGLSEGRARELLRRADPRLIAEQPPGSGAERGSGPAPGAGGPAAEPGEEAAAAGGEDAPAPEAAHAGQTETDGEEAPSRAGDGPEEARGADAGVSSSR